MRLRTIHDTTVPLNTLGLGRILGGITDCITLCSAINISGALVTEDGDIQNMNILSALISAKRTS